MNPSSIIVLCLEPACARSPGRSLEKLNRCIRNNSQTIIIPRSSYLLDIVEIANRESMCDDFSTTGRGVRTFNRGAQHKIVWGPQALLGFGHLTLLLEYILDNLVINC